MARPRPLKRSLVLDFSLSIVVLATVMLGIAIWAENFVVGRAADTMMRQVDDRLQERSDQLRLEWVRVLRMTQDWARERWSGDWWSEREFREFFVDILSAFPRFSSVWIARETGDIYVLTREDERWVDWIGHADQQDRRAATWTWTRQFPTPVESREEREFPIFGSPWFTFALGLLAAEGPAAPIEKLTYTGDPRELQPTGRPGSTVSFAMPLADGTRVVIGLQYDLNAMLRLTMNTRLLERGRVAILYGSPNRKEDLVFLAPPFDPGIESIDDARRYILQPVTSFGGPTSDLLSHMLSLESYTLGEPVRFDSGGEVWWGTANEVENTIVEAAMTSQPVWFGAIIPESDLLERIPNLVPWMLVATAIVLILAIYRAVRLAGTVSRPVEQLVEQSRRMQRLDFSREETIRSDVIEIGILASTLDSMRRVMQTHTAESEQKRITDAILRNTLSRSLPVPSGYQVGVLRLPTEERGGDLVDVIGDCVTPSTAVDGLSEPDSVALLVLAPEGFGVEAAVASVELRASFRTGVRAGLHPGQLADHLDRNLREDLESVQTARAWFGKLDGRSNRLLGLAVGVEAVLHYQAREARCARLPTSDTALGRGEGPSVAQVVEIGLAPGDIVTVVTRGVVDALSATRTRFGVDRVAACIGQHFAATTPEIIERLQEAMEDFCSGARATDDRTILVIKRLSNGEHS